MSKGDVDRTKKREQFKANHDKMDWSGNFCEHHVHLAMKCRLCDNEIPNAPELLRRQGY